MIQIYHVKKGMHSMKKYYVLDTNILLQSSYPKCAQITFTERESVRSALATEALARLN